MQGMQYNLGGNLLNCGCECISSDFRSTEAALRSRESQDRCACFFIAPRKSSAMAESEYV
jgi:hypothetical protein